MPARWSRVFALVAVIALMASAECIGDCSARASNPVKVPTNSCHHHKSPVEDIAHCSHQHSDFSAPEAGIASVNIAATAAEFTVPAADLDTAIIAPIRSLQSDVDPPLGLSSSSAISVLRI
jgi:hypothetical protein